MERFSERLSADPEDGGEADLELTRALHAGTSDERGAHGTFKEEEPLDFEDTLKEITENLEREGIKPFFGVTKRDEKITDEYVKKTIQELNEALFLRGLKDKDSSEP